MTKRRGNFDHNYPLVIDFLEKHCYEYYIYNGGQQLRIMGATKLLDFWPSRMVYHIIESEQSYSSNRYDRLDFQFNEEQFKKLLE